MNKIRKIKYLITTTILLTLFSNFALSANRIKNPTTDEQPPYVAFHIWSNIINYPVTFSFQNNLGRWDGPFSLPKASIMGGLSTLSLVFDYKYFPVSTNWKIGSTEKYRLNCIDKDSNKSTNIVVLNDNGKQYCSRPHYEYECVLNFYGNDSNKFEAFIVDAEGSSGFSNTLLCTIEINN